MPPLPDDHHLPGGIFRSTASGTLMAAGSECRFRPTGASRVPESGSRIAPAATRGPKQPSSREHPFTGFCLGSFQSATGVSPAPRCGRRCPESFLAAHP